MNGNDLEIAIKEVLRYLGYRRQTLTQDFLILVKESIKEVKSIIDPKYIYSHHSLSIVDNKVIFDDLNIVLDGNSIVRHLKQCNAGIFMTATLGIEVERLTRLYEKKDLTKALIIDACATTAIEEVCDKLELSIEKAMLTHNKYITSRFSPGYGDLTLKVQKEILNILDAQKQIGLTCSDHNILIPRKSVTAIIGISSNIIKKIPRKCSSCPNFKNCKFRKDDESCEFDFL